MFLMKLRYLPSRLDQRSVLQKGVKLRTRLAHACSSMDFDQWLRNNPIPSTSLVDRDRGISTQQVRCLCIGPPVSKSQIQQCTRGLTEVACPLAGGCQQQRRRCERNL